MKIEIEAEANTILNENNKTFAKLKNEMIEKHDFNIISLSQKYEQEIQVR